MVAGDVGHDRQNAGALSLLDGDRAVDWLSTSLKGRITTLKAYRDRAKEALGAASVPKQFGVLRRDRLRARSDRLNCL